MVCPLFVLKRMSRLGPTENKDECLLEQHAETRIDKSEDWTPELKMKLSVIFGKISTQ
jgi:hypothetical protein